MSFNKNSGWGKLLSEDLHAGRFGKVHVVGSASLAHSQIVSELFDLDPEGKLRYFTDIDTAVNECVASAGDRIVLLPGYTETVSSATAINLDVAGIKIVGLGTGTLVPTLTFDTAATATIPVSANDIEIENVNIVAGYADIVAPFTLTTAKNFKFKGKVYASAANFNFLNVVDTSTTGNAADGLTLDVHWVEPDLATLSLCKIDADLDGLKVDGYLNLGVNTSDLPAVAVVATGKDLTNVNIGEKGLVVIRLNDANPLLITADTTTANTGVIRNTFVRHLDTAAELMVTAGTNIGFVNVKGSAVVDKGGYDVPALDA